MKALHGFSSTVLLLSYFGSVYLLEFFLKGELLAGIFFWELSPPPPPVISNGPPLNKVMTTITQINDRDEEKRTANGKQVTMKSVIEVQLQTKV